MKDYALSKVQQIEKDMTKHGHLEKELVKKYRAHEGQGFGNQVTTWFMGAFNGRKNVKDSQMMGFMNQCALVDNSEAQLVFKKEELSIGDCERTVDELKLDVKSKEDDLKGGQTDLQRKYKEPRLAEERQKLKSWENIYKMQRERNADDFVQNVQSAMDQCHQQILEAVMLNLHDKLPKLAEAETRMIEALKRLRDHDHKEADCDRYVWSERELHQVFQGISQKFCEVKSTMCETEPNNLESLVESKCKDAEEMGIDHALVTEVREEWQRLSLISLERKPLEHEHRVMRVKHECMRAQGIRPSDVVGREQPTTTAPDEDEMREIEDEEAEDTGQKKKGGGTSRGFFAGAAAAVLAAVVGAH